MKRLAIIPARGGSKRIPNKNTRLFCSKPMIAHILITAQQSDLFDVVHVSTESETTRDLVAQLGFQTDFMRPVDLAGDHTPIMPVLRFVVEEYAKRGMDFEEVWLLMACAALIDVQDLRKAAELFNSVGAKTPVLAIAEYPVPVEWAFRLAQDGVLKALHKELLAVRSQDLEKRYFDSGTFVVYPAKRIIESEDVDSDGDYIGYVLPKYKAVDIDDEQDWQLAEAIFRSGLNN